MTISPLLGKRILITRPRAQAAELYERLNGLGATPILFPTIALAPMEDYSALDTAIMDLTHYAWLIFTSVNGVEFFCQRLEHQLRGLPRPEPFPQVAAIGPATARALEVRDLPPAVIPVEHVAEALARSLGEVRGQRVLVPHAELARETLAAELTRRGAIVHEVPTYRTVAATPSLAAQAELQRGVDVIIFTSASTVKNFVALVGKNFPPAIIACIGPIAADTAHELGLPVQIVAHDYTTEGLVAAIIAHYA